MRIINGPKWLNIANMIRSVKVAPLTVSDNMIADKYLLSLLMTTCKPGDFLIFIDASIELQLFTSLDLGDKNDLKSQFLCTDIDDGISKMITPYEEAAAKEAEDAKKAKEEQAKMASYKLKYESSQTELAKVKSDAKIALEEVENRNNQITKLHDELDSANSTITELRTALQSAADKIESMRDEFNAACKEFGLSKDVDETGKSHWSQDLDNQLAPLSGSLRKLADSVTNIELPEGSYHWECKISELVDAILDNEKIREETFRSIQEHCEHLQIEFDEVCKEFGLSRDSNGNWSQDLTVVPKYVELLNQYQDKVTELSSTKSKLDAKSHDYEQLVVEFENYKKSWNDMHDRLIKLEAENKSQDEQIVRLHTIIGKASAKFNAILDGDELVMGITTEDKSCDADTTAADAADSGEVDGAVSNGNAPKEITE